MLCCKARHGTHFFYLQFFYRIISIRDKNYKQKKILRSKTLTF